MKKKRVLQFQTIYRKEKEGGYTALVPSLPGCISYGRTLEEAKEMIEDAIGGYIHSLRKHGEEIPNDTETVVGMTHLPTVQYA